MKNLFIINEDERKRILGLHENATKRQYLGEAKTIEGTYGTFVTLDNEDNITKNIFSLLFDSKGRTSSNINEKKLVDYLLNIENINHFKKIDNELKNAFKMAKEKNWNKSVIKYSGLDDILNDVLDWNGGDDDEINRLVSRLNDLGVGNEITQYLRSGNFDSSKLQGKVVADPDVETKKSDWDNYPCVTSKGKQVKLKDGSLAYNINGVYYFSNGRKMTQNRKMLSYNCSSPEFVTKKQRVVPTTEDQLLKGQGYLTLNDKNDLVSKIQTMLKTDGQNIQETGVYDKQTYDAVKNFQTQDKTLKADGILGKKTFTKLKDRVDLLSKIEFKAPNISDVNPEDDVVVPT